ncbi:hypothetical protein BGZ83_004386 [Gryganskiella cystojenkinii]|nr:hypothetical protein BGZ83_004386 [Gryganskiella cystojenkinii]
MENYHRRPKTSKSKFEDDDGGDQPSAGKNKSSTGINPHNKPQQHGVMVISPHGKIRSYVTRALEVLTETDTPALETSQQPTSTPTESTTSSSSAAVVVSKPLSGSGTTTSSPRGVLTIKAQGKNVAKAVTVAEILKRRMGGSLHQFTEIGQISEQEIWDPNPDQPNLDPLTVTRHRPTIRIRLSKELNEASTLTNSAAGLMQNIPGASIPRDEHADPEDEDDEQEDKDSQLERWPGAILDRDAIARRFVGYQAPTGNDIYL